MKNTIKKPNPSKKKKTNSVLLIRYLSVTFVILFLILAGNIVNKATNKIHVLGASTGPILLADTNDTPDNNSNLQPSSLNTTLTTNNQTITPQQAGIHNTQLPSTTILNQPSNNTQVDCIGPDGKQFTTNFNNCQKLNQKWGNDNFNFTPLGNVSNNQLGLPDNTRQIEPTTAPVPSEFEIKTKENLQSPGYQIQIKNNINTLTQINQSLGNPNLQIIPNSTNGLTIKSGNVQAETNLPISLDPITKSLAVTTPNGTKDLTILPDQAVQNVLDKNILSSVLSSANQMTPNVASANKTIALTNINNQPAFAIQGISNSKLLGIFPVAFPKTVYVSAQNGKVLQTQESFVNQLLQSISF